MVKGYIAGVPRAASVLLISRPFWLRSEYSEALLKADAPRAEGRAALDGESA